MRFMERKRLAAWRLAMLAMLALLFGIGIAGATEAPPLPIGKDKWEYPVPPVGTRVEYTDGYTMTVIDTWPSLAGVTVMSEHPEYGLERITYAFGFEWYAWALLEDGDVIDSSWYLFNTALVSDAWPLVPGFEAHYYTLSGLSGRRLRPDRRGGIDAGSPGHGTSGHAAGPPGDGGLL